VTCSAGCCMSTNKLHERIYAPYAPMQDWSQFWLLATWQRSTSLGFS
jgi:hypothetical protein